MTGSQAGQAEIEDLDLPLRRPHQVVRLHVAVDHAALVGVLQAERRLPDVLARFGERQRPLALQIGGKTFALDELHDEEVQTAGLVGVEGGDDVRVLQLRRRPHLLLEALHAGRVVDQGWIDDLERDQALHPPVFRLVDGAHAALAEQGQHAVARVVGQFRRHEGGGRRIDGSRAVGDGGDAVDGRAVGRGGRGNGRGFGDGRLVRWLVHRSASGGRTTAGAAAAHGRSTCATVVPAVI